MPIKFQRSKYFIQCLIILLIIFSSNKLIAQQQKVINNQLQTWISINSTMRLSSRWGAISDFHIRRNNFMADPGFYFIRFGGAYWINEKFTLAGGYAHLWQALINDDKVKYSDENRLYQQAQYVSAAGKTAVIQRVRNEQRWQQKVVNDTITNDWRFTNRVRYLASFSIPVSHKPGKLSLVFADEILLQFGEEVIYNTFDQNRLFVGIKQKLNHAFSYDFGYMMVYQQKYNGYQYDLNHTIRLFFYYAPDFRKDKKTEQLQIHSGDE